MGSKDTKGVFTLINFRNQMQEPELEVQIPPSLALSPGAVHIGHFTSQASPNLPMVNHRHVGLHQEPVMNR